MMRIYRIASNYKKIHHEIKTTDTSKYAIVQCK